MEIITRAEAKEKGLKRYFTGKPCKHGHISERMVNNGGCLECDRLRKSTCEYDNYKKMYRKKYHNQNRDTLIEKSKRYRNENLEKCKESEKKYREDNPDKVRLINKKKYEKNKINVLKKQKEYYEKNKTIILERNKHYRKTPIGKASRKNSHIKRRLSKKEGDVTTEQLLILQKTQTHCYWCGNPLKNKASHVDHYIPLSKGGKHTISNLVMACASCNLSKGAKMPEEFANSRGKLL